MKCSELKLKIVDFGCASFIKLSDSEIYNDLEEREELKLIQRCNKHIAPEVHHNFPRTKFTDYYGAGYTCLRLVPMHHKMLETNYKQFLNSLRQTGNFNPCSRPNISELLKLLI